jgi:hypothetical protein
MHHVLCDVKLRCFTSACRKIRLRLALRAFVTQYLSCKKTTRVSIVQAFLDNALLVQQQATDLKTFLGDSYTRPYSQQLRVLTDILNAVGCDNEL